MSDQDKSRFDRIFPVLVEETRASCGDGDGVLILKNYCPTLKDHDPSLKDVADYFQEWCKSHPILSKWPYERTDREDHVLFHSGEEGIFITTNRKFWTPSWGPDVLIEVW